MKKELLAPAGDVEAGYAALYYGADAVYLGLQKFSARATAANFDEEALNEFTGYAHSLGKKVFVAINTLIQEKELPDLLKQLDICSRCRVDAVILQDLGVARIIREQYPELEMHASTQMAIHNKEGALALQKLGFSRVVLARELTLPEIEKIAAIPGLETEAFIHGALCYSYSGMCLFSSLETGKSANRGKCLYPCRAVFKGEEGEKHFFSMKDMALQEDVLKMPVTSLKIEGRKKTALYVAAVTDYYRKILDGKKADTHAEENIKQIFSRPWCKFHFNGRDKNIVDRDFVGHRGLFIGKIEQVYKGRVVLKIQHEISRYDGIQIDVKGLEKPIGFSLQDFFVGGKKAYDAKAGDEVEISVSSQNFKFLKKGFPVYLSSSTEVKRSYGYSKPKPGAFRQKAGADIEVFLSKDSVKACCGNYENEIAGDFEKAAQPERMEEAIRKAFTKAGSTNLCLRQLAIHNEGGYFVPVSLLNELRRGLYEKVKIVAKEGAFPEKKGRKLPENAGWIIKTDDLDNLSLLPLDEIDEVIFMLSPDTSADVLKQIPKNKLRLALPAICRESGKWRMLVEAFVSQGYKKWEISNYWGLEVLPQNGIDISLDSPVYMMNSQAVQAAKEMGVSRVTLPVEDSLENLRAVTLNAPLPVCLNIYQDVPLFTSAGCIRSNPCKICPRGEKRIKLEKGGKTYEAVSRDCQTTVLSEKAFCAGADAAGIKADYYRADFVWKKYSAQRVLAIWQQLRSLKDIPDTSKGNLVRGLL